MSKTTPKSWTPAAVAAVLLAAAPLGAPAHAGSEAVPTVHARLTPQEAADFSKEIERRLAADGVRVAMVFRTGFPRDQLPRGIDYTHGAFWIYREIVTKDGGTRHGYAVYNLYNGDGHDLPRSESFLKQDWPLDFVRGTAVDDVGVIVPSPEMQRRILAVIDSATYEKLHNPSYSLVANPAATVHQNCTTFLLDVVASAAWRTDDQTQIAANLRAHFEPQKIEVGGIKRVFGPMVDDRLRTDDQSGPIYTATYASLAEFMKKYGLLKASYAIRRDAGS
jgi:hypothetical protein